MKGKRYFAAMSLLVLALGSLSVLVPTASGKGTWPALAGTPDLVRRGGALTYPGADYIYSFRGADPGAPAGDNPHFWRSKPERTVHSLPTEPPFTEYVTQHLDLGAGTSGGALATCPSASIVVGGGYVANPDVAFFTQYMSGNGWRGEATNNAAVSRRIEVYAVCLHNSSGTSVTQVHGQVDVRLGTKSQALATYPAGSIATGGGFLAYADGSLRVYNSSKSDSGEGWQAWAQNLSASTKTLFAYAICLSGSGGTTARIMRPTTAAPGAIAYAFPRCGGGKLVTGGGFAAQQDLIIFSNSGPHSGDEWRIYVKNSSASGYRDLFAYAICLSFPELPEFMYLYLPLVTENHAP